jgi:hypothetical protein
MGEARKLVGKGAFECTLIVISVVLGLLVNAWRERAVEKQRLAEVRTLFLSEIRANREQLASQGVAPLHQKLSQAWTRLAMMPSPSPADRDAAWAVAPTGMHPFHPRDAVWTSFAHGDLLQQMPGADLLTLAEIYRAQEDLRELNRSLHETLLMPTAEQDSSAFIRSQANVTRLTLNDIVNAEGRLLEMYGLALR